VNGIVRRVVDVVQFWAMMLGMLLVIVVLGLAAGWAMGTTGDHSGEQPPGTGASSGG
jgi:hypothetical protein